MGELEELLLGDQTGEQQRIRRRRREVVVALDAQLGGEFSVIDPLGWIFGDILMEEFL